MDNGSCCWRSHCMSEAKAHKGRHLQTHFITPSNSQMMYELYCQRMYRSPNTISFSFMMNWREKSIQLLIKPENIALIKSHLKVFFLRNIPLDIMYFQSKTSSSMQAWLNTLCPFPVCPSASSVTIWNIPSFNLFSHTVWNRHKFPQK